jgi:hypothetical protein
MAFNIVGIITLLLAIYLIILTISVLSNSNSMF